MNDDKTVRMNDRVGRTNMWTQYPVYNKTERNLAVLKGYSLYLETGEQLDASTFVKLVDLLFQHNLLAFCESIVSEDVFFYLQACVADVKTQVICNKEGIPSCIRIERKKRTRWIVPARSWDTKIDENFMPNMRQMYTYVGSGVRPTPSSLGTALMYQDWTKHNYALVSGVNRMCADFLYDRRIGARCDTEVEKGTFIPEAIEIDMASGYLAHLIRMMCGTSIRTYGRDFWTSDYFTFFCEVDVTIHNQLALGPFPVRKRKQSKIQYPTKIGTYSCYLWKEQIQDAIAVGCTVELKHGYAWRDSTEDTLSLCQSLYSLRVNAPTDFIEHSIKKITTSAIGRFGTHTTFYTLVDEQTSEFGERCIVDELGIPYDFYVREKADYTQVSMIHWYSYNIMLCSRTLYRYALPYAEKGTLLMTNYDAILVLETDETHTYAQKHTLESKMCGMGDWRWIRLTNITILGDRSLKCDQKVTTPGVKR